MVEFVGSEHTPRNLMIRAVKGEPAGDERFVREYQELKQFLGVTPYLEGLLGGSVSHAPKGPSDVAQGGSPGLRGTRPTAPEGPA